MQAMRARTTISERRACVLMGLSRTVLHYAPCAQPRNDQLRVRIQQLAAERRRRRRRGVAIERRPLLVPQGPSEVWSIDFVMDALEHGRRLKCLTIVDDFTKEAIDIVVDHGISGHYVARVLEQAGHFRELPRVIRTDQGPEFTSKALDQWAYERGITLRFIQAGKPTQNAYVESFNGKFRDECLNEHWFRSLGEARAIVAKWRMDYNQARPHSALDYQTPAEFASAYRARHAALGKVAIMEPQ